jgi:hypothetical protein
MTRLRRRSDWAEDGERDLVAGRLPRQYVCPARVGLLPRGSLVADASLVRRRPGDAEVLFTRTPHRSRRPRSDGWPASSPANIAACERIYDREWKGRPRIMTTHLRKNIRRSGLLQRDRSIVRSRMAAHRRLPRDPSILDPVLMWAVHSNDDDVDRGSRAGCRFRRGGDGDCGPTRGGISSRQSCYQVRSSDGSLWHPCEARLGGSETMYPEYIAKMKTLPRREGLRRGDLGRGGGGGN